MQKNLPIEKRKLSELIKPDYNPRTLGKEEYDGLKESIKTFGYVDLLIVNKRNSHIVGGNQRSEVLKELGYDEIDVVVVDVDGKTERKLNVVLNSQAISGKYDDLKLSEILEELKLDDDYESLRLHKLDPLDLSDKFDDINSTEDREVNSEPPVSKCANEIAEFVRDNMGELENHPMDYQEHFDYIKDLYIKWLKEW